MPKIHSSDAAPPAKNSLWPGSPLPICAVLGRTGSHTPVITPTVRLAGISYGVITPDVLQRDQPENAVIPTSVAWELSEVLRYGGVALHKCVRWLRREGTGPYV